MRSDFFEGEIAEESAADGAGPAALSLDEVFTIAYEELRRLARSVRRSDPHASLTPTALVNEAWMKLARTPGVAAASPLHFKRIAGHAMRQILVDAARRRQAQSRGSGAHCLTFDEAEGMGMRSPLSSDRELLALDGALEELARLEPRQAALVEARFFGGLETAEIATQLGISEATALRDWRAAKAWLAVAVRAQLK